MSLGEAMAWYHRLQGWWVVMVSGGVGAFLVKGTQEEAERIRRAKASWEHAVAHKRPASVTDFPKPEYCWNHPGFARIYRWSRAHCLETPRYYCECPKCRQRME